MSAPLRWYDHNADNPPWIKALAEVRIQATREGWCHAHVQAIIVAIDQYAEAALGNRSYFLNKPYVLPRLRQLALDAQARVARIGRVEPHARRTSHGGL